MANDSLAPYAVSSAGFLGREHEEPFETESNPFDVDRHRVMSCTAFRRLQGKTQVFGPTVHDHFRTRLTHSFEVAQISRVLAKALHANQELAEVIALAHDLGHPPFGHAGESALQQAMGEHGGFNHNLHSVRVVCYLEHPYPSFRGLNLARETLEGLGAHCTQFDKPMQRKDPGVSGPTVEAQIVSLADRLAYDMHDLEDAIGAGYLGLEDLGELAIWRRSLERVAPEYRSRNIHALRRIIIDCMVQSVISNVVDSSRKGLQDVHSIEDVRAAKQGLVVLGKACDKELITLEKLLREQFYRRPEIKSADIQARSTVLALFEFFHKDASRLPERFARRIEDEGLERVICDYIAGMTDRFATSVYEESLIR